MIKKLAVLAMMATLLVACGAPTQEEIEAKAKATADSLTAVLRADSMKAAKAAAAAAAAATAAMDSAAANVDAAAAAVKEAVQGH